MPRIAQRVVPARKDIPRIFIGVRVKARAPGLIAGQAAGIAFIDMGVGRRLAEGPPAHDRIYPTPIHLVAGDVPRHLEHAERIARTGARVPRNCPWFPPTLESEAPFAAGHVQQPAARPPSTLPHAPTAPWTGLRDLPVMGTVVAGSDGMFVMNGQVHDYIERPPSLQGVTSAYAVYVADTSMVPRYFPGETLHIHPGRAIAPGDDTFVVVQIKPEADGEVPRALVKRYKRQTADTLVLKQFNPPRDLVFPLSEVESIHLIIWAGRG